MKFVYDDGGRGAAGFKGEADDCVCRSIAIATGLPYREVYALINAQSAKRGKKISSAREGVYKKDWRKIIEGLGWRWHPTMAIGKGCTMHLREGELPDGKLIVFVSKHLTAVINGVVHDTSNPSRGGTRCVYGYFTQGG